MRNTQFDHLNPPQLRAVTYGEGPLLVLAGPGSGKTSVIVDRILYLIRERYIPPEEILVITFTKDAALSMQQRFHQKSENTTPVSFGTFHSIFYHILLQSPQSVFSRADNPKILTQIQKKNILQSILRNIPDKTMDGTMKKTASNANRYVLPACLEADAVTLLSAIEYYKNTDDEDGAVRHLTEEQKKYFPEIFALYQNTLRAENLLDFEDMVFECRRLLERDTACRRYWQNRFSYILVDEFQDINPLQYQVLKLLSKPPYNLFAVGDDDQAIYGFRGSEPACLKRYAEEFGAEKILLDRNYRSGKEIVEASLKVIGENRERFAKKLYAAEADGKVPVKDGRNPRGQDANAFAVDPREQDMSPIRIYSFEEREQELAHLIAQIKAFQQRGSGESCAVLFRTNLFLQSFGRMLNRQGIPYVMRERSKNIYEHFVAKDITAYLKFAAGDRRRGVFLQFMNKPSRYLRRDALGEMEQIDLNAVKAWYEAYGGVYRRENIAAVDKLTHQLKALENMPPGLAIRYVCKAMGYEGYLKEQAASGGTELLQDWLEILDWLKLDAAGYGTVKEWLEAQKTEVQKMDVQKMEVQKIDAQKEPERSGRAPKSNVKNKAEKAGVSGEEGTDAVRLMTIHAAKGLEFDKVWIPDCNEKNFPHGSLPDRRATEEERRIFYVGMTRAKKSLELLYLTGTKERPRLMSRFLNPIEKAYSSNISSNSQLSRNSSKASATFSYSSSSSM